MNLEPVLRLEDELRCNAFDVDSLMQCAYAQAESQLLPNYYGRMAMLVLARWTSDRLHHIYLIDTELQAMEVASQFSDQSVYFYFGEIGGLEEEFEKIIE